MIKLLLVLAQRPDLAAHVHILRHQCHEPLPDVFDDLPRMSFVDRTLSGDRRTKILLSIAIRNLVNVHTLYIIMGHYSIVYGLITGFFNRHRPRKRPLKRLWIESSSLDGFCSYWSSSPSSGLESLRYRRARLAGDIAIPGYNARQEDWFSLTRGSAKPDRAHTSGHRAIRTYNSSVSYEEISQEMDDAIYAGLDTDPMFREYNMKRWDDREYVNDNGVGVLPEGTDVIRSHSSGSLTSHFSSTSLDTLKALVDASSDTIASVTLDWLADDPLDLEVISDLFVKPSKLRAMQFRNSVMLLGDSPGNYLFGPKYLPSIEKRTDLKCLSWPIHRFVPDKAAMTNSSALSITKRLGQTLIDLRIDYPAGGYIFVDNQYMLRRRLFIEHVASRMKALKSIKIEGNIPDDERRETIRALHNCPIKKLVLITYYWTGGDAWANLDEGFERAARSNTWDVGTPAEFPPDLISIPQSDEVFRDEVSSLPSTFHAIYGPSDVPLLHTIALHYGSTITELKLCGFNCAPILHCPAVGTSNLLAPLRHFHVLHYLTTAIYVPGHYRGTDRSYEVTGYNPATGSPCLDFSIISLDDGDGGSKVDSAWAQAVRERFDRDFLAQKIVDMIGPHLSEKALRLRKEGVTVKALFLLTKAPDGEEIFDLEVDIGKGRRMVGLRGPTGEEDEEKVRNKLKNRGWF